MHRKMRTVSTGAVALLMALSGASCGSGSGAVQSVPVQSPCRASATTPAPVTTSPAAGPGPRGYHVMVALEGDRGLWMWGGETAPPPRNGQILGDAWAYRGHAGWVPLAEQSPPEYGPVGYDAKSDCVIVLAFLGRKFEDVSADWLYDPRTNSWQRRKPGERPTENDLLGAGFVYDSESDRLIMFGLSGNTWAYDINHDRWTLMNPSTSPHFRNFEAMVYDPQSDRVVLFGGDTDVTDFGDTWTYDFNRDTWREATPAESPAPRVYSAMAYDPKSHRMVLFGGVTDHERTPLGDTWAYDVAANTWSELKPKVSPSARGWHAMAYYEPDGKFVLFGGGASREQFLGDTWIYDPAANTWAPMGRVS